jgi:putative ATP-dependent endonuclease of the OLD family
MISQKSFSQVIVTTHSPYLLNMNSPESNILLRRHVSYNQLRETERVPITPGTWMAPFGQALGLESDEMKPWKDLMLSSADAILLVEGDTDKEYFEMLRDKTHGQHQLAFEGEVASYDGTGNLHNTILLRFLKNRLRKLFVTYDLDAADHLEKRLDALGLKKGEDYLPIGIAASGKRNVEGLLPESVTKAVYGSNPAVVQAANFGTKEEQDSAKSKLKKLLLEEFKKAAKPTAEYFGHFYSVVKVINKALV